MQMILKLLFYGVLLPGYVQKESSIIVLGPRSFSSKRFSSAAIQEYWHDLCSKEIPFYFNMSDKMRQVSISSPCVYWHNSQWMILLLEYVNFSLNFTAFSLMWRRLHLVLMKWRLFYRYKFGTSYSYCFHQVAQQGSVFHWCICEKGLINCVVNIIHSFCGIYSASSYF